MAESKLSEQGTMDIYDRARESADDYLKTIFILSEDNSKPVRVTDIARLMGYTKASVSRAVRSLSPVIITTLFMPSECSSLTTCFASSRSGSSMQSTAASVPPTAR